MLELIQWNVHDYDTGTVLVWATGKPLDDQVHLTYESKNFSVAPLDVHEFFGSSC